MARSYRPTLETLERREVFSSFGVCVSAPTLAVEPVSSEQFSLNFTKVEFRVAAGDVNGDGVDSLAVESSLPFAGDGFGLDHLLPYVEQDNFFKSLDGLSSETQVVDSSEPALAVGDVDRQGIIAILIGLKSADQAGESFLSDGTSNTLAVTHDAELEKWADAFSAATPERQSQIIAILIGLVQQPTSGDRF